MEVSTQTVYNFSQHSQIGTWQIILTYLLIATISTVIYGVFLYRRISGEIASKREVEELDELNKTGGD